MGQNSENPSEVKKRPFCMSGALAELLAAIYLPSTDSTTTIGEFPGFGLQRLVVGKVKPKPRSTGDRAVESLFTIPRPPCILPSSVHPAQAHNRRLPSAASPNASHVLGYHFFAEVFVREHPCSALTGLPSTRRLHAHR